MVRLNNDDFSKQELLKLIGDISQIGGVQGYELNDGNEKNVEAIDFRTGTGFNFTVLAGRGMDIAYAEYKGVPLCWRSSTGNVSACYFEPEELSWLRSFFGGLLTTCGLTYFGHPCVDQGKKLGLHGRISNIPAKNVHYDGEWQNDEYIMWVQGKVRETAVFGENISLTRRISSKLGNSRLFIHDTIENLGHDRVEHMILYHFNIGFPILDEGSELISPTIELKPYDKEAEKGKENYNRFSSPIHRFKEKCYYHQMKADGAGKVSVALVNRNFNRREGIGIYIKYSISELPNFTEWKMMGEGMYVVGLEPSNCLLEGRDKHREKGTLPFLEPGEKKEYHLEVGILESTERIRNFEKGRTND